MPRISIPFAGPANTLRSIIACPDEAINEVLESTQPGSAKTAAYSRNTPGLKVYVTLEGGTVRGLFEINDSLYAVAGSVFYSIADNGDGTGTATALGSVSDDTRPVSMASNGTAGYQVLIASGGLGYIWNFQTNTFSQIIDPDFPLPCRMVDFLKGYFVALKGGGSRSFSWSALEDGLTWDVLDVTEVSNASDNITALIRNHAELWAIGFRTSEVFITTGDPTSVFAPYQDVVMEVGGLASFGVQRIDNTLMWVTQDDRGSCMVIRMDQFVPRRVSTFAVEWDLQQATTPTDAVAFTAQMEGHIFYCLVFPRDIDHAWLYDVTMDRWTKVAHWNANIASYEPYRPGCHAFCYNTHLFGDRLTGAVYRGSFDITDEELVNVA